MLHNPFYIWVLPVEAPFCNRKKELSELTRHSLNKINVALFSPRRYGKTSLIKRVLGSVESKGMIPIYINLAPQQISLLETVAKEPTKTPFAIEYSKKHRLGSIGGIQGSIKRLIELDYVEKDNGCANI